MLLPDIDPVAFAIGPLVVRWYALAYIIGLVGGWVYARHLAASTTLWGSLRAPKPEDLDDLLVFAALGVVIGGRLGFVLFYKPGYYAANPLEILQTWKGGMSFMAACSAPRLPWPCLPAARPQPLCPARSRRRCRPDRAAAGPSGEFHQGRALGAADHDALGHHLPGCRTGIAASLATL